jgi:hypothetical protein
MGFFSQLQKSKNYDDVYSVRKSKKKPRRRKPKKDPLENISMGFFSGQMKEQPTQEESATAAKETEQTQLSDRLEPFYGWAPAADERLRAGIEYSIPLILPTLAYLLQYSSYAWSYCFVLPVFHTLETMLTDFGPKATGLHLKWTPITPLMHLSIDLCLFHPFCMAMFVWPDIFGPTVYFQAFALLAVEYVYWACAYKDVVVRRREAELANAKVKLK